MLRICFLLYSLSCSIYAQNIAVAFNTIAKGLTSPVGMTHANDGSGRLFVIEMTGKIKIIKDNQVADKPFLDIGKKLTRINAAYSEKGLLGIAFHPQYKSNGRFFVYYSAPSKTPKSDHKSILAEYKVSSNPDIADPSSEKILMEVEQPKWNHNGGQLAFGPDGYLYVALGDGGGHGDPHGKTGNGQNLQTLLGKILRIDVNKSGDGKNYGIPSDNPFASGSEGKPEIFAYGLRNPWRFSFDKKTGELFAADVGQDSWEEIDIIKKGGNYGWKLMEGNHCYYPSENCKQDNLIKPIAEYHHKKGICVTGGFVYRGQNVPDIQGKYIFADWTGKLFYLEKSGDNWAMHDISIGGKKDNDLGIKINTFAEDENGELYVVGQKISGTLTASGVVYRLVKNQ